MEKKEDEREKPKDREREAPGNTPRENPREREQARAPLRSKYTLVDFAQRCPKTPLKQMSGWTCGSSACSRDTNRPREVLAPVNNEKVPPVREHPRRHFSGGG